MHVRGSTRLPPTRLSNENKDVAEGPALPVATSAGAGPSSMTRPTMKSALQLNLIEKMRRKHPTTAPPLAVAPVISPEERQRMAASALTDALLYGNRDAKIIKACQLNTEIFNNGGVKSLEKLVPWLRSSQNTSEFKSLIALVRDASPLQLEMTIRPFTDVGAQTQVSREDRIFRAYDLVSSSLHTLRDLYEEEKDIDALFDESTSESSTEETATESGDMWSESTGESSTAGARRTVEPDPAGDQMAVPMEERVFGAVERLRTLMGNPDPTRPMPPANVAALQTLQQVFLKRKLTLSLDAYKAVAPMDNRPEKEIERDVKDLHKLTAHWLLKDLNRSPIKSLQAMVESPDIASVKRMITNYAITTGNSPQRSENELASSSLNTLPELVREARQGVKRRASEEAGESSTAGARRKVEPNPAEEARQMQLDNELNEELKAVLESADPPPSLSSVFQN